MTKENNYKLVQEVNSSASPVPSDESELRDILEKIRNWKPTGNNSNKAPRIAVFGQYASGKSSFLNSLHWVQQFQTHESPGQFEQIVPSSREDGITGGGNTNRLRIVRIGPIEFVDTRGYPPGDNDISSEIKRICDGTRDFVTDIVWDNKFRIRDYFQAPIRPMDFAILIVGAKQTDYSACRRVIKAIKDISGCIPIVIVTSKSKIPEGEEIHMHSHLTGMGAAWAFFIENYVVDSKGIFPTREDLKIKQHLEFCKILQAIEREYDAYQNAVSESRRKRPLSFFLVPVLVVLFAIILACAYQTFTYPNMDINPIKRDSAKF